MKNYKGSCQCGAVTFEFDADIPGGMTCNCSRCHREGFVLGMVPAEHFTVLSGEDNLTEYRFNKNVIQHLFCKTCGVQSFGRGKGPDGAEVVAVNLRCVDGVDIDSLPIQKYNGKDI